MYKAGTLFLLVLLLASCDYFKSTTKNGAVARVGQNYLFAAELDSLVPFGASKVDSLVLIKSFINRWVTQKLLISAAELNLDDAKKEEFNVLIKKYKNDFVGRIYYPIF